MKLANYFRISAPAAEKVPAAEVDGTYRRYRSRTFWGVTAAYSLYYVCRMVLSVVKQPLIDEGKPVHDVYKSSRLLRHQ